MIEKQYSTLYAYRNLEELESALQAIHRVIRSFDDVKNVAPTLVPKASKDGDIFAQAGYVGAIFFSEQGPKRGIQIRDHDKDSFDHEAYVQEST